MVETSDQWEIQLDIKNKELVAEDNDSIIEKFEAGMGQANEHVLH